MNGIKRNTIGIVKKSYYSLVDLVWIHSFRWANSRIIKLNQTKRNKAEKFEITSPHWNGTFVVSFSRLGIRVRCNFHLYSSTDTYIIHYIIKHIRWWKSNCFFEEQKTRHRYTIPMEVSIQLFTVIVYIHVRWMCVCVYCVCI